MKKISISTMIYLEEYKGIKEHERANNNVMCFQLYKNNIEKFNNIPNSSNSAIYFLFNNEENSLYIGKTTNLYKRMCEHNKVKDFNSIFAFVMKNNDFSQTYIDYIEYHFINELNNQFFYKIENKDKRFSKPIISEHESVRIEEIISCINEFLYLCNIDLKKDDAKSDASIFSYKKCKLVYTNGVFILLKDSQIFSGEEIEKSKEKSKNWRAWYQKRIDKFEFFIKENSKSLKKQNDWYVLTHDIEVYSSSWAACLADGQHSRNGWKLFKNSDNKTLDEVYRK